MQLHKPQRQPQPKSWHERKDNLINSQQLQAKPSENQQKKL